jgi:hypothetical protein
MACELMSRGWELVICNLVACVSLGNEKFGVLLMFVVVGVGTRNEGGSGVLLICFLFECM